MKLNINSLIPIYGGCIQVIPCKVTQLNLKPWIMLIWDFTVLSQILKFIHADLFGFVTGNLEWLWAILASFWLMSIRNLVSSNCP